MATGDFWYNSDSGAISQQQIPDWLGGELTAHLGVGWHGPFKTKQAATDYYNQNKAQNPGWKAPTDNVGQQILNTTPGGDAVQNAVGGATSWFGANIETLLIRVGEILLGLVLVGIGVASLTGAGNVISKAVRSTI